MESKKKRLGRGLDALLGRPIIADEEPDEVLASDQDAGDVAWIPVAEIDPNPYQPRSTINPSELEPLARSIQQHGVLQPVLVRRHEERYQLIAGERRLRAAELAGLSTIPARVIEATEQQLFEFAIVENLQRSDLNPIEKARAFKDYLERFGGTQRELAERLSLDVATVSNFIRLLELPDEIQREVELGKLSMGHARALLGLKDREHQIELAQRAMQESWSVRKVEKYVANVRKERNDRPVHGKAAFRTPHIDHLEDTLTQSLGTTVQIKVTRRHQGKIVIEFKSEEDFDRIVQMLTGQSPDALAE